jgi:hypothetical protein
MQRQRSRHAGLDPDFKNNSTSPFQYKSLTPVLAHVASHPFQYKCVRSSWQACVTGISADVENSERQMTHLYLLLQRREEHGFTIEMSESQIKHSMQSDHENHDTESTWQNS